jgi:hypothetical protein
LDESGMLRAALQFFVVGCIHNYIKYST